MKTCFTCKIEKPLDMYSTGRNQCKACIALYQKNYREINKKELAEYKVIYNKENRPIFNKNQKKWRQRHPDKKAASTRNYQLQKSKRMPNWLTKSDLIEIIWAYTEAKRLIKETGIEYVVDHIIPLKGKNISGLHCPQNLQIITKEQNLTKGNKWPYKEDK